MSANGAFEVLFSVGFEEGTDTLILPFGANISVIKAFRDAVQAVLDQSGDKGDSSMGASTSTPQATSAPGNSHSSTLVPMDSVDIPVRKSAQLLLQAFLLDTWHAIHAIDFSE